MGIKVKIVILVIAFFCSRVPASLSPPGEILHLDYLQGNVKHKTVCGTGIAHPYKIGRSGGGGGGSRPAAVGGGRSNGRGSATIPLYAAGAAAGAANDRRNSRRNHNGSNRNYNCKEIATLAIAIVACFLLGGQI